EIARAEEDCWEQWAVAGGQWPASTRSSLDVERLLALPLAAQRRLVRAWTGAWTEANAPGVSISFRLIEEILELARGPAGKKLELGGRPPGAKRAGASSVRRGRQELELEAESNGGEDDYEYALAVPGDVRVPELGVRIEARVVDAGRVPEDER